MGSTDIEPVVLLCFLHHFWNDLSFCDNDSKVLHFWFIIIHLINGITISHLFSFFFAFVYFFFFFSASVAKKLHEDCFALIFGINTLIALILQSLLTLITITKLQLSHRTQYQLYAYLFFALTAIYGIIGIQNEIRRRKKAWR